MWDFYFGLDFCFEKNRNTGMREKGVLLGGCWVKSRGLLNGQIKPRVFPRAKRKECLKLTYLSLTVCLFKLSWSEENWWTGSPWVSCCPGSVGHGWDLCGGAGLCNTHMVYRDQTWVESFSGKWTWAEQIPRKVAYHTPTFMLGDFCVTFSSCLLCAQTVWHGHCWAWTTEHPSLLP